MFEPLVTAMRTLTSIPIPGTDSDHPASALPFFPLVGGFIGAVFYVVAGASALLLPEESLIGGLFVMLAAVFITGALHIDGLADVADAFGAGGNRERIFALLKDSRHGTFGVTAITCSIAGRILLSAWYIDHRYSAVLLSAAIFSRTLQAWGCSLVPYAHPGGGGTSVFFSGAYRIPLGVTTCISLGICGLILRPLTLAVILLSSLVPVLLFFNYSRKKIGGLTGDGLGAANEIAELSFLLCGVVCFTVFRNLGL